MKRGLKDMRMLCFAAFLTARLDEKRIESADFYHKYARVNTVRLDEKRIERVITLRLRRGVQKSR